MTLREIFMESFSTVEKLIKGTLNMDGNIFFSNRFDPSSEAIAFNFDLQRFAQVTITSKEVTVDDKTETKYFYENSETATPYNSELEAAKAAGAVFYVTTTNGTGTSATTTNTYYNSADDFKSNGENAALKNATKITILGDITLSEDVTVNLGDDKANVIKVVGTATLNLGAHDLTVERKDASGNAKVSGIAWKNSASASAIVVQDGANFTVKGTGKIDYTWKPATDLKTIKAARHCAAIQIGQKVGSYIDNLSDTSKATFNMESGTVQSYSTAVSMSDNAVLNVNGGTIRSTNSCGVYYGNLSHGGGTINVNGGTLETDTTSQLPAIQVAGDVGDTNVTKYKSDSWFTNNSTMTEEQAKALAKPAIINVSGGTIAHNGTESKEIVTENGKVTGITADCNPNAICASGNVKLTISGGTITSSGTAIEIRAGSLDISGGTIESTATQYVSLPKSGGSSYGVGVSIAQHTTLQNIDVNISGTTNISGLNALGVANPQGNSGAKSGKVTATIDGGNLSSKTSSVTGDSSQAGNAIFANNANIVITVNNGTLSGNVTVSKVKDAKTDTNDATVVVAGGTTTGKVQVLEKENKDSTTETLVTGDEGKKSLQVVGGKISDSDSASDYVADGAQVNKDGTVTESTDNGWSLTSDKKYEYLLSGKTNLLSVTVGANTDSINFKYDKDNKTFGIPGAYETAWNSINADVRKPYGLAKYTVASGGGAVTIEPAKPREGYTYVKISGTDIIDNTIVTLTAGTAETLGLYVDATDNRLAHIIGGKGQDSLKAGDRRSTLDGGANDDTLDGGEGIDTFIYSAGKDVISNYEHGTDIASLNGVDAPIDFDAFTGSDFVFKFNDADQLTFRSVAEVALTKGTDVYTYQGNTNGNMNYIAHKGNGISLGSGYSGRFNGAATANEDYKTIDAERVGSAIRITGNDKANYIVASSVGGGTLEGGEGDDTLTAAKSGAASLRFEGGAGSDSLFGGAGYNLFVYNEGVDSIKGYHSNDLVTIRGNAANLETADFAFTENDIKLGFGTSDSLIFQDVIGEGKVPISIQSGKNLYVYEKEKISHDKSVTLTSGYSLGSFAAGDNFDNINAVNVSLKTGAISISGNDNNNVIFGSKYGGSIFGGKGNDKLDVTERITTGGNPAKFVFKYDEGKDTVDGFKSDDKLDITAERIGQISKAKSSKGDTRLAFTFNTSKSDVLTFNSDGDEIGRVSLSGDNNGFLTKDGVVSIGSGTKKLDLFESSKGKIDLTEAPYASASINAVDASDVAKQTVTLIGGTQGGTFTFAGNNKKKDQFEYNGGNVTISGYEAGKDRLNLNTAALSGFSVSSETNGDVSLGAGSDVVVLKGMKGQEVLLHHADSKRNSFTKMVFKQEGVILNKEKRPTMATVYSGANYSAATEDTTVKKIFIADGITGASIVAGDKNKTTLDASASNGGVTLTGGAKNDKLIGSTVAGDTFIYTGGKDIIQNYSSNDQISLGSDFKDNLLNSKISAGSRSIKFKFAGSSKNTLTIKPAKGSTLGGALFISDTPNYTYAKNAIASGTTVSLTSEFSGSYRLKNSGVNNVDGSLVKKNLTYRGTSADETLSGGTKKTTFKGGGGKDSLKGGSGNDIFFYAKGDSGNTTIADFDFTKDKLKIAGGTITKITVNGGAIEFDMNNGRKNSANIGSFKITGSASYTNGKKDDTSTFNPNSTLIKANNTYYWFAKEDVTDSGNVLANAGNLITTESKVSKSDTTGYAIIDLGYSSNLVNAGVATKITGTFEKLKPTLSGGQS